MKIYIVQYDHMWGMRYPRKVTEWYLVLPTPPSTEYISWLLSQYDLEYKREWVNIIPIESNRTLWINESSCGFISHK